MGCRSHAGLFELGGSAVLLAPEEPCFCKKRPIWGHTWDDTMDKIEGRGGDSCLVDWLIDWGKTS